jgi:hypothetical protein
MRKYSLLILLGIGVSLASGCAGMAKNLASAMPWGEKPPAISEGKYQAPAKMVALWSPAMYNTPGKPATRGFGGRLYFYNAKNETVPVQGQLVVYCFDDTHKTSDHKQADRRVAFTPEQFSGHFSPTELGASYSVWVPWDAVGNPQAEVSLMPIFTAATGQVVVGQQSLGLLPGPESPLQEKRVEEQVLSAKKTQDGDITRVGFDEEMTPSGLHQSRLKTMSIALPQSLAERVAASRNQEVRILPQPEAHGDLNPPPQAMNSALPGTAGENDAERLTGDPYPRGEGVREQPRRLGLLTHSERSQPRAPVMQHPRPTLGPARMQPPLSERPSSHP